jgi:hypothetical protein
MPKSQKRKPADTEVLAVALVSYRSSRQEHQSRQRHSPQPKELEESHTRDLGSPPNNEDGLRIMTNAK